MSNHSVIEHRANYHYIRVEEDYIAICSGGQCSPHCKALILTILEHWTNTKRDKGESEYIYLTMPQWNRSTYMFYERNLIEECIAELIAENKIERRPIVMYDQKTFEYKLNVEVVQACIAALPAKSAKDVLPNLDAYLAFKQRAKERRQQAKSDEVGEKSRTVSEKSRTKKVREKSPTVREKSPEVGDNSPTGYGKNHDNESSITKLPLDSTQESTCTAPVSAIPPSRVSPSGEDTTHTHTSLSSQEERVLHDERPLQPHRTSQLESHTHDSHTDPPASPVSSGTPSVLPAGSLTGQQEMQPGVDQAPLIAIEGTTQQKGSSTNKGKQPLRLPVMPSQQARWNAETAVQIVEAKKGRCYSEATRKQELGSAKKLLQIDYEGPLTREQFEQAWDEMAAWSFWTEHTNVKPMIRTLVKDDKIIAVLDELKQHPRGRTKNPSNGTKSVSSSLPPGNSWEGMTQEAFQKEFYPPEALRFKRALEQKQQRQQAEAASVATLPERKVAHATDW